MSFLKKAERRVWYNQRKSNTYNFCCEETVAKKKLESMWMWMWMWMWGGGGRLRNCTGETSLVWRSLEIVRKRKIAASLQQKQPSRRDGSKCCCKTTIFVLKKKKTFCWVIRAS